MPKVLKIKSSHIFAITPGKHGGMKLIVCLQRNTKVSYKKIVSLLVDIAKHAQSTQNNKFAISLQYLKENVKDEVDFFACRLTPKISLNWYYHSRRVARHAQITWNNKFSLYLQYLKKEVSDEVGFLHAYTHESWQIDTKILMGMASILKVPNVFTIS